MSQNQLDGQSTTPVQYPSPSLLPPLPMKQSTLAVQHTSGGQRTLSSSKKKAASTPTSVKNKTSWKDILASIVTIVTLISFIIFIGFIVFLLSNSRVATGDWDHYIYLLIGLQTITFTGIGWLFGKEVNREQAEVAKDNATEARKQATTALAQVQTTQTSNAAILAQAQALYAVVKTQTQTAHIVKDRITRELNTLKTDDATYIRIQSTLIDFLQTNLEQLTSLTKELAPKSNDVTEETIITQKLDDTIRPVPNLQHLDFLDAFSRVSVLGMGMEIVGEAEDESVSPGLIVSQNPLPGTLVQIVSNDPKQKALIQVVLSIKPKSIM